MLSIFYSWWALFASFFVWYAIAPLLSDMRDALGIAKYDIWRSSVVGVSGTIVTRVLLGPLCDWVGPRICLLVVLVIASVRTACTGLVGNDNTPEKGLPALRFFIGFAGGVFVM